MTDKTPDNKPTMLHMSTLPHIRNDQTASSIMLLTLCALIPALIASVAIFGFSVLIPFFACILAACGTEIFVCTLFKLPHSYTDFSSLVTGTLLAFSLPPQCPIWMGVIGSIFAVGIVKMAFGGLGQTIVNPALAAQALLLISYPAAMSTFSAPLHGTLSGMTHLIDGISQATPLSFFRSSIATGLTQPHEIHNALQNLCVGNIGGCMGETSKIALLAGAAFLIYKRVIPFITPLIFIGTVFILFWFFNGTGSFFSKEALDIPLYQILSGGLFLTAFFMATDPVTSCVTPRGRIFFGIGCGMFTFCFRIFGNTPEGTCFAVLLMNIAAPLIDHVVRPKPFGEARHHE